MRDRVSVVKLLHIGKKLARSNEKALSTIIRALNLLDVRREEVFSCYSSVHTGRYVLAGKLVWALVIYPCYC